MDFLCQRKDPIRGTARPVRAQSPPRRSLNECAPDRRQLDARLIELGNPHDIEAGGLGYAVLLGYRW